MLQSGHSARTPSMSVIASSREQAVISSFLRLSGPISLRGVSGKNFASPLFGSRLNPFERTLSLRAIDISKNQPISYSYQNRSSDNSCGSPSRRDYSVEEKAIGIRRLKNRAQRNQLVNGYIFGVLYRFKLVVDFFRACVNRAIELRTVADFLLNNSDNLFKNCHCDLCLLLVDIAAHLDNHVPIHPCGGILQVR